jgi:mannosyltransferase
MEVSGRVSAALDPSAAIPRAEIRSEPEDAATVAGGRDPLARGFLLAACALAALRFVALGRWSLWLDEALTLSDAHTDTGVVNPLGYALFGWVYGWVERPDELLLRLPAAVFGFLAILATASSLRAFFGARASALAAFFVAASPWHLYWSQNARFYTLAQLLALVGGGALLAGLYRGSVRRTALGLLALGLAALTHPSAVFLLGALLFVPWVVRWLEWVPEAATRSRAWDLLSAAGLVAIGVGSGWALRAWFKWEDRHGSGSPLHFLKTAGYLFTPTLGLAFVAGLVRRGRARASFAPVLAVVIALGGAVLASFFVRVSAQYVFVLQPWVAACAGLAFVPREGEAEPRRARVRAAALACLVALPALVESALYFTVRNGDRPHWREAYAHVLENRGPMDLVLGMEAPVAEYYLVPGAESLRAWTAATWLDDFRSRLPLEWARYPRRTWFVVNPTQLDDWTMFPGSAENRTELIRILQEECERVASFPVPYTPRNLDVHVYVTRER